MRDDLYQDILIWDCGAYTEKVFVYAHFHDILAGYLEQKGDSEKKVYLRPDFWEKWGVGVEKIFMVLLLLVYCFTT